jgi:DNA polymerase elongation subunit (family B)
MYHFNNLLEAHRFYLTLKDKEYWYWNQTNNNKIQLQLNLYAASDRIISIQEIEYDDYVYDIETEDGTFQAGGGSIIAKNTDSIFTKFILSPKLIQGMSDIEILNKTAEIAQECGKKITSTFKHPINLEFEKITFPLLLFTKKRYAYLGWEPGKDGQLIKKGICIKGLQLIKREYCPFVKNIGNAVLNKLLIERDAIGAQDIAKKMIQQLFREQIPIQDLIMSKQLRNKYSERNKNGELLTKPAHWYLSQRMLSRDPINAPKGGDRVQYVFIECEDKKALQKDRIEDPNYVVQNDIPLDTLWYFEKQVVEPLYTIFSCTITDKNGNAYHVEGNKYPYELKQKMNKIWEKELRLKQNDRSNQNMMTNYFSSKK